MLTISREQMHIFSKAPLDQFVDWMLVHLRKFFPSCRRADDTDLRKVIKHGIERAGSYEIRTRRDVCKYIDLMVTFGLDFDRDKRFPWAESILKRPWSSATRMRWLMVAAQNQLKG
jgi:hypothetical protein